jgi:glycosyltransferase involved in cell wall biosynthesis
MESAGTRLYVSVIIPVYNDLDRLYLCLQALERQTYPRDRFEVIVADNGSAPPLRKEGLPGRDIAVVVQKEGGSYAARNAGIRIARGDVLAFTDSDCIPSAGWLEHGVETLLRQPECGLVAGRVEVFFADRENPTSVELYERAVAFRQQFNIEKSKYAATANLFTFRRVMERVGTFRESMISGGDTEWGARVAEAGYAMTYSHNAAVRHPARASFDELKRKIVRVAYGNISLHQDRSVHLRNLAWLRMLSPPLYSLKAIWTSDDLRGAGQRSRATVVALRAKYTWAWHRIRYGLGLYDRSKRIA